MKRFIIVVIVFIFSASLFAQGRDKPPVSAAVSSDISAIQTAYSLAKFGYSNYSASALIEAAEILSYIEIWKLEISPVKSESWALAETRTETPPLFTPANLLAEARKYAVKDSTMIAWIDRVQKRLIPKAGVVGGPKQTSEKVQAFSTDSYIINFKGEQLAQVYVSGDGSTDLDLFVYDQNNALVTYVDDYTDECLAQWIPARTGSYTIVVKNTGRVWNRYYLTIN